MEKHEFDVVVVGKGNAALCAALAAKDQGAKVALLEAASEDEHGGNSRFAGGVMRFAYASLEDLRRVTDISDEEAVNSDFGTNTREEFLDVLYRLTKEHGIASIPVSVFYRQPPPHKVLRFCFAKSEETLARGAEILCKI